MKTALRRIPFILLFLTLVVVFTASCEREKNEKEYDRVVVLYIAANNNLSSFAIENVTSLKKGYIPLKSDRNVLLLFKHTLGAKPQLIRISTDRNGNVIEEIVSDCDDINSGNHTTLKKVLNKVNVIFPADEYGLILWSHSTGWLPKGYYSKPRAPGVRMDDPYAHLVKSFGEDRGQEMEIADVRESIPFKLEFLIFDCCFMGGVEVIYEFKDLAKHIVAAPTEILANGFPYENLMGPLFLFTPDLNKVVDNFYYHYAPVKGETPTVNNSATIALYNTDKLSNLATISKEIFMTNRDKIASLNRFQVQPYYRMGRDFFFDFGDFVDKIATPLQKEKFNNALNEVVVKKMATDKFIDIDIDKFSGLSIYIPVTSATDLEHFYMSLEWNRATLLVN